MSGCGQDWAEEHSCGDHLWWVEWYAWWWLLQVLLTCDAGCAVRR
jgi:hypothetical protein